MTYKEFETAPIPRVNRWAEQVRVATGLTIHPYYKIATTKKMYHRLHNDFSEDKKRRDGRLP